MHPRRRARRRDPVWAPLLEGLRLLQRTRPAAFTKGCWGVAFCVSPDDARLIQSSPKKRIAEATDWALPK
jgi:hypothetical protein